MLSEAKEICLRIFIVSVDPGAKSAKENEVVIKDDAVEVAAKKEEREAEVAAEREEDPVLVTEAVGGKTGVKKEEKE